MKKESGRGSKPIPFPIAVNGIIVKKPIPEKLNIVTIFDARLWINGIFFVLIMWITRLCVYIDSMNHPVWNAAININLFSGEIRL